MARPPKLNEALLPMIRQAVRLGLSAKDSAAAVGVSESSWHSWRSKAEAVEPLLEGGWRARTLAELRRMAEELELDLGKLTPTGARGGLLKGDVGRAVADKAQRFLDFLEELKSAEPFAKAALLGMLDLLSRGGNLGPIDPATNQRRGVRRTKTVTTRKRMEIEVAGAEGKKPKKVMAWVEVEQLEIVEERETPPNRMAIVKMLQMRWPEEFGNRRALDPHDVDDPQEKAKRIADAVVGMFQTVPDGQ